MVINPQSISLSNPCFGNKPYSLLTIPRPKTKINVKFLNPGLKPWAIISKPLQGLRILIWRSNQVWKVGLQLKDHFFILPPSSFSHPIPNRFALGTSSKAPVSILYQLYFYHISTLFQPKEYLNIHQYQSVSLNIHQYHLNPTPILYSPKA